MKGKDRYIRTRDKQLTRDVVRAHWAENEKAFEAGVQYALDRMLILMGHVTIGPMELEHITASDILDRVKTKGP